jgi:hypothetical protein
MKIHGTPAGADGCEALTKQRTVSWFIGMRCIAWQLMLGDSGH